MGNSRPILAVWATMSHLPSADRRGKSESKVTMNPSNKGKRSNKWAGGLATPGPEEKGEIVTLAASGDLTWIIPQGCKPPTTLSLPFVKIRWLTAGLITYLTGSIVGVSDGIRQNFVVGWK
jgi:hypothetical protein